MSEFIPIPMTFQVHPLVATVVRPVIEKLIRPDSIGEQYRALVVHWTECRFPPVLSYAGDIFQIDLIGPVEGEGAGRRYSEAYLRSDAYAQQLGARHATAMAQQVRVLIDNSVGTYLGNNRSYKGRRNGQSHTTRSTVGAACPTGKRKFSKAGPGF